MQNCIPDGLLHCTGVMYKPLCFTKGRDGIIFKVGILIEALFHV